MPDLNITDLLVRLQLTGCKFSDLANTFANDLKFGRKCAKLNQKDLLLLNAYIEILECYNLSTNTTATVSSNRIFDKDTVELFVDNISISGVVTLVTSINTSMTYIVNAINSYQSDYTASLVPGVTYSISISGPCDAGTLSATVSNPVTTTITVAGFTGGVCTTNCITEEQAQSVIDKISKLTKLCFQPLGFEYTES